MTELMTIEDFASQAGELTRTSDWVKVDQPLVNTFADATYDHQFIHVDPGRATQETPFGGTIAHGFLTLSLLSHFVASSMPKIENAGMAINYGFEKIRFLNPVKTGSNVRCVLELERCVERKPGEFLCHYHVNVEIENGSKPALVARWLSLVIMKGN